MNILIKAATIIEKNNSLNGQIRDILILDGVISKIDLQIENSNNYKEIILDNLHVSAGWFDTSVSFGEPGFEERETIDNGLETAALSGFTDVAVNSNTNPKIDNKTAVEFLKNKATNCTTNLHPIGNLTKNGDGLDIAELFDMQNSGAIAFGDYNSPISNDNLMKVALQYAQNFNGLIMSFPQNNSIARDGIANESKNSTLLGLKGLPALAEELQIVRDLFLLEYTGGKLHIPTISTAKSMELIQTAKNKGLDVSCSVAAHHLTLTDDELHDFNGNKKVLPPLRNKEDTEALIEGVNNGVIDIVTSDHNPIDVEHKKVEFNSAKPGTIGLESLFGALNGVIGLENLVHSLTANPRERFNLKAVSVTEGQKATLTFFNPKGAHTFSKSDIKSTSENSIFLTKDLLGKAYGIYSKDTLTLNN